MSKNNFHRYLVSFWGVFLLLSPFFAYASEFSSFSVRGVLAHDGSLSVEEHFIFDFGNIAKHGIIREIPLYLPGTNKKTLSFQMHSVSDGNNLPYRFESTDGGNTAVIKVGEQSLLLTGKHYYDVQYSLSGAANESRVTWQILSPVNENIKKLQADLFFPVPVPPITATATCAFMPNRYTRDCYVAPLIKDNKLFGYRVQTEQLSKDGIYLTVNYPRGLIQPPLVVTTENKFEIPHWFWYIIILTIFFALVSYVVIRNKEHIEHWRRERKKPVHFPDAYSYIARAIADKGRIDPEDIIATVADLTARGYIVLTPIANPVGDFEFIDYALSLSSDEYPGGSEGALLSILSENGGIPSFYEWLRSHYHNHAAHIEEVARAEIIEVTLLASDEKKPSLPGFNWNKLDK